jgi:hypothetical protein
MHFFPGFATQGTAYNVGQKVSSPLSPAWPGTGCRETPEDPEGKYYEYEPQKISPETVGFRETGNSEEADQKRSNHPRSSHASLLSEGNLFLFR